jgi:hypothetical protein
MASGQLKILIVGANDLDRIVTASQQQPYYILECGNQRSRSKPCLDSGTNPTWNTAHKFNITDEVAVLAVIKDEGTKGVIGQGMIELPRCAAHRRLAISHHRSSTAQCQQHCTVYAQLTYMYACHGHQSQRRVSSVLCCFCRSLHANGAHLVVYHQLIAAPSTLRQALSCGCFIAVPTSQQA